MTPKSGDRERLRPDRGAERLLRRVTVAYTVNELGNWLGAIALTVAVFDHTRSALATAALFVSVRFLPALAVTPAVAWLESLGFRRVLSALYCVQAFTTAGLAMLVLDPVLAPILVLGAADGVAALAAKALLRATVSQHSADDDARRRANGLLNSCWSVTFAVGPALGGVLNSMLGPSAVLLLDVASFAITAVLVVELPAPGSESSGGGLAVRLRDTVRHLRTSASLGWLLGTEALAVVFFAAVVPVEVVLVKTILHGGDAGYGGLLASWGAGTVVGGAIFRWMRQGSLHRLLAASTLAIAVAYLGIASSTTLAAACALSLVGGIGNGMQWIALVTAVQEQTPAALQGRLMGVVESVGAMSPAVGFSIGGAVTALSSPRATFVMAGVAALLAAVAFALLAARHSGGRQLTAGTPVA